MTAALVSGMRRIRAELGQSLFAVTLLALSSWGCSSSSDGGTDVDGGSDTATEGGAICDTATVFGCCCHGDVQAQPICTAEGVVCPAGFGSYTGDDCRCLPDRDTPCCLPHVRPDTGTDASCAHTDAGDACCCDLDVIQTPKCGATGAPTCTAPYRLFFGDDCTRSCGPCNYAPSCVDTGVDGG